MSLNIYNNNYNAQIAPEVFSIPFPEISIEQTYPVESIWGDVKQYLQEIFVPEKGLFPEFFSDETAVEPMAENFLKLFTYIRNQGEELGMDSITIRLTETDSPMFRAATERTYRIIDREGILHHEVEKVVLLRKDLIENYGDSSCNNNGKLIDNYPDDPKFLRKLLLDLPREHFNVAKQHFYSNNRLSDEEVHAAINHELGHLHAGHVHEEGETTADSHQKEYEADSYACRTPALRKGMMRLLKRQILEEIFTHGQNFYQKGKSAHDPESTHPSNDLRLSRVENGKQFGDYREE